MIASRRRRLLTIGLLIAAAASLWAVRWCASDRSTVPSQDEAWRLTMDVQLHATQPDGSLLLYPPHDTRTLLLTGQQLSHDDFYIQRQRTSRRGGRQITANAKRAGELRFFAVYDLHYAPLGHVTSRPEPLPLAPDKREIWLGDGEAYQLTSEYVRRAFEGINDSAQTREQFVESAFRYVQSRVRLTDSSLGEGASDVFRAMQGTALGKTQALVALLRLAKVPARTVVGFRLQEQTHAKPHFWTEAYVDQVWIPYDPTFGYQGQLPGHYLPMNRGGTEIVSFEAAPVPTVHYKITRKPPPVAAASDRDRLLLTFDLTHLDLAGRAVLGMLMLLPLCVLLTTSITRITALNGYGVFTPTLLALAAVYSRPLLVIAMLGGVVLLSLLGRWVLLSGKTPRGSRLGLVFTLVVLCLAFIASGIDAFWFDVTGEVLLPVVVLTSLSDNVFNVLDEKGARVAFQRLVITVILALLAYLLLVREPVGQLLLAYPELHLATLAAYILLTLYRGPKLTAWGPLRWLDEPARAPAEPVSRPVR